MNTQDAQRPESDRSAPLQVHLVTILYKSEKSLSTYLDCLQAQTMKDWRLFVIDNDSPDGSREIVEQRNEPRITVIRNPKNLGFAKAANQGMRAATDAGSEFIVLMNNDTAFGAEFLADLIAIRSEFQAGVIAPRIMKRDQPGASWYAGGSFDRGWVFTNCHHAFDPSNKAKCINVDFAPGCCLGITREVLQQVGLFDESFFVYWEDADFCLRLARRGIKIAYVPEPFLLHAGAESSGGEQSPAYMRLYYRSYMQMLRKHFGVRHAAATMLRLLARQRSIDGLSFRTTSIMARAMLLGLCTPLAEQAMLSG